MSDAHFFRQRYLNAASVRRSATYPFVNWTN